MAEIEKLKEKYALCPTRNNYEEELKEGRLIGYKDALHKLNTLEVKDVDLKKEVEAYLNTFYLDKDLYKFAKHFYELGLNVRKEE